MTSTSNDAPRSTTVWAALTVVYIVWGSTYLAIRIVVETIPPFLGAAFRFLAAAVILAVVLAIRQGPAALKVPPRRLASAALVGILLLTTGNGLVGIAERHISSGLTALLVASVPLWLVLFRRLVNDRPPLMTVAGTFVGFGGLAVLTLTDGGGSNGTFGIVVVLIAALSWASGSFLSGRLPMPESPFVATVYEMAAGGAALLVLSVGRGEHLRVGHVSTSSWLALGYLIVFGSLLAFTSYVWLLGSAPISLVGTYAYVNPAVAVLLGAVFMSEPVHWPILVGGAVIIVGVGLVVSTERTPRPAPAPEVESEPSYRR